METFSALLALCAEKSPVAVNSPHKGQWSGALMFSVICVWINDWVSNREAGDLRRHRGHYDVNVMMSRHLPEMPAECQTLQIWLPLTALTLRWNFTDFKCLLSWPWWRHRERSDPRDTKSESKIPSTLLPPLLWFGLLRTLSTLNILVNNGCP